VIIFRYLGKEVYVSLLATTIIMLVIFITNQFVHYLNDAAAGQITATAVMQVMSLQVPLLLGYLLPLGLYLGILVGFGRLYMDHEMTILSACGVSRARILRMTMAIMLMVFVVVSVLMIWVEPIVQKYRTRILDDAIASASIQKVMPANFQSIGNQGAVFYAEGVTDDKQKMENVFLATPSAKTLPNGEHRWDVTVADSAIESTYPGVPGDFLVFQHGHRYIGSPGMQDYQTLQFDQYGVRLDKKKSSLNDQVKYLSTSTLWKLQNSNRKAAAELQWRMAMPISVIIFALLAFPLSHINPRQGKFAQLVPAILIYIVYADLVFLGRAWIERGTISPQLGMWWIHGIFLVIAIALNLYRVKKVA